MKMKWENIKAIDFCNDVRDGTHDTPKKTNIGYKLVTSKCLQDGNIDLNQTYYISKKDYFEINKRSKVEKWDVLFSMIGNGLGKSLIVKDNPNYAIKNLALFKLGDEYKAKWLHYYLSSPYAQAVIYNTLQGTGQPFISLTYLRNFLIPNPPKDIMHKYIDFISLYDDLIENNKKQIKLLEEAAEKLYKEWFIKLNYPNHENEEIIDGIPKNWQKEKLNYFGNIITGKTPSTKNKNYYDGNIPFIKIPDMHNGVYTMETEQKLTIEGAKTQINKFISEDSLIVSCIGTAGLVNISYEECQTNQQINSIVFNDKSNLYYVYLFMKRQTEYLNALGSNGATMVNVNKEKFSNIDILIPSEVILKNFSLVIKPYFEKIKNLQKQILLLREARNKLLPKLMNGDIEV